MGYRISLRPLFGTLDADTLESLRDGDDVYFDVIYGGDGDDTIYGGELDDTLYGDRGKDTIYGRGGNDHLFGGEGDDTLVGEDGDDILDGGAGSDVLNGGRGNDTATYENSTDAVFVDLLANRSDWGAKGDSYVGIENLIGSDNPNNGDYLRGDNNDNRLEGLAGDDVLYGWDGWDTLFGGDGNDVLDGGNQNDILYGGDGDDTLFGGAGADRLGGGSGADYLYGGSGLDAVDYRDAPSGVTANLLRGFGSQAAAGDHYQSIEQVLGSTHADTLIGNHDNNQLYGGEGIDNLTGHGGHDVLDGGPGEDWAYFEETGAGSQDIQINLAIEQVLNDGTGSSDVIRNIENIYIKSDHAVVLIGNNAGNEFFVRQADLGVTIDAGGGDDLLRVYDFGGNDIDGGLGIDTLIYGTEVTVNLASGIAQAGSLHDQISGIENVTLVDGNDTIIGDSQSNVLHAGGGQDTLNGGGGDDHLAGGSGDDVFQFGQNWGHDFIDDFDDGSDIIAFHQVQGLTSWTQLTITQDGSAVHIEYGSDSIQIENASVSQFSAEDFLF